MRKSNYLSLLAVLGLAGQFWVSQATIAPQVAQAYTSRVDISLDNLPNNSFEALLRRAEAAARAAAQRSFDRDILATQALVIVTAQNNGATTPILTLDVSRAQWKSRPDTKRWATYYRPARALLGFDRPGSTPTSAPPTLSVPPVSNPTTVVPGTGSPTPAREVPFPGAPGSVPTPGIVPPGTPTTNTPGAITPNLVSPGVPPIPTIQTAPTPLPAGL